MGYGATAPHPVRLLDVAVMVRQGSDQQRPSDGRSTTMRLTFVVVVDANEWASEYALSQDDVRDDVRAFVTTALADAGPVPIHVVAS